MGGGGGTVPGVYNRMEQKKQRWFYSRDIHIITSVFHTAKSRIVLNNYGAVLTKLFNSILFHMAFYTELVS